MDAIINAIPSACVGILGVLLYFKRKELAETKVLNAALSNELDNKNIRINYLLLEIQNITDKYTNNKKLRK